MRNLTLDRKSQLLAELIFCRQQDDQLTWFVTLRDGLLIEALGEGQIVYDPWTPGYHVNAEVHLWPPRAGSIVGGPYLWKKNVYAVDNTIIV